MARFKCSGYVTVHYKYWFLNFVLVVRTVMKNKEFVEQKLLPSQKDYELNLIKTRDDMNIYKKIPVHPCEFHVSVGENYFSLFRSGKRVEW